VTDDEAIAEYIARRGATRCPAAFAAKSTAAISAEDRVLQAGRGPDPDGDLWRSKRYRKIPERDLALVEGELPAGPPGSYTLQIRDRIVGPRWGGRIYVARVLRELVALGRAGCDGADKQPRYWRAR